MNITVFGAGYVGLVTGVCLAAQGHKVWCVDVDEAKIGKILAGISPIYEPGLQELMRTCQREGRFFATTSARLGLIGSEVAMIAVGTPDKEEGGIDLKYVEEVASTIGKHIATHAGKILVVVKSTVVPGTTEEVGKIIRNEAPGVSFGLGMNPEFLREGFAVQDFAHPDRIVLGASDTWSAEKMLDLYDTFDCRKIIVTPTEAEITKYAANALMATLISFANEVFQICEITPGARGERVIAGVLADRRWTPEVDGQRVIPGIQTYVMGGIGWGGSCFPKDLNAITHWADGMLDMSVMNSAICTNDQRPYDVAMALRTKLGGLKGKHISVLGLAFKPGTDDWRNSPSQPLIRVLQGDGAIVSAWDPMAGEEATAGYAFPVKRVAIDGAFLNADCVIIATAWPKIKTLCWPSLIPLMNTPFLYDGRGLLRDTELPEGTIYQKVGDGPEVKR
jgi:UDPglucose 6-dehydrogenase